MDPDTAIGGLHDRFPSTRHSLFDALSPGEALPQDALNRVVTRSWKPAYKFIRLKWHKDKQSQRSDTNFFASALEREFFQRFDPRALPSHYLRWLWAFRCQRTRRSHPPKRGGGWSSRLDFDSDSDFAAFETPQCASSESPEEIFHREWQRQLFMLALDDLRTHCRSAGKQLQFRIFEEYDLADGDRPPYAELARRHGIAETSLTNHLAWARRMLRTFVTERLRRHFRRTRTARGNALGFREAAMTHLSDSLLRHLREVVDLPDLTGTRYRLEAEIGRGGMGVVYAATDRDLDRRVAIKVLDSTPLDSTQEARVIARLEHPAIVPIYDAGTLRWPRILRHESGDGRAWTDT
jgi:hypothetical protein